MVENTNKNLSKEQAANLRVKGSLTDDPKIINFIKEVDYAGQSSQTDDKQSFIPRLTRYRIDASEKPNKGIQDLLSINFTKILVPNYKVKVFTINRLNQDYLHLLLNRSTVRDALLQVLSNMETVKGIIDECLHISNFQVSLGNVVTSYTTIRDAIKTKAGIANMSSEIHIALTFLFMNYLESYGLVLHEPEIDAFVSLTKGDSVKEFLNDTILNSYTASAVASIPEKFTISAPRTTTFEMAVEFVSTHALFRERLMQYDYFARAYKSVISRLNSYFSHSGFKNYGDDFASMLDSPSMSTLLSYGNIIQSALDMEEDQFTNTPARHWSNEEDKVIEGINYLVDKGYIKVISKLDILKSLDARVIYSVNDDDYTAKRYVLLRSKNTSAVTPKCFRMFRYDGQNLRMFTREPRMVDLAPMHLAFNSLDSFDLIVPFLQYYVKPLSDRHLIIDNDNGSLDETNLQLIAMCLADGVYIDRNEFGTVYYQYSISIEDIRTGVVSTGVQDVALTTNYRFLIFNKINSDLKQSSFTHTFQEDIDFKPGRLYVSSINEDQKDNPASHVMDPNPSNLIYLIKRNRIPTVNIDINGMTTKIKLDVYEKIFQGSLAEYVLIINPSTVANAENYFATLKFIKDNIKDSDNESLLYLSMLPSMKSILASATEFDGIAYNLFWNYARKNNFIKSDVINDVMFKLSVKVISAACLAYFMRVDLTDIWDIIDYRKLEFAREIIRLS